MILTIISAVSLITFSRFKKSPKRMNWFGCYKIKNFLNSKSISKQG
jgi:hypothetical protein